ncbi:MAG: PEP-CTERM sorting domain-containing protein [Isosphaeraceae bacterium]|nr:PEP-CTERM sorting domain-containing protein [Isosphaeraceae bacterium]
MARALVRLFAVVAVLALGTAGSVQASYVYSATVGGSNTVELTQGIQSTFDVQIRLTRTADSDTRNISGINFGFWLPNAAAGNIGSTGQPAGTQTGMFTGAMPPASSNNAALLAANGGQFASSSVGLFNVLNYRAGVGYSGGNFFLAAGQSLLLATLKVTVLGTAPVGQYAAKFQRANSAPFTNITFTNFTSARPTDTNSLLVLQDLNINIVPAVVVPEPSTIASAAVAALGTLFVARRRRAQA